MKIRIKSVKSKIIVFFIGLAAFQICVMAGFAKLQLEPSIVSMYSEHFRTICRCGVNRNDTGDGEDRTLYGKYHR